MNPIRTAGITALLAFALSATAFAVPSNHDGFLVRLKPSHAALSADALKNLGLEVTGRIEELNIVVSKTEPKLSRGDVAKAVLYSVPNYFRKLELYSESSSSPAPFSGEDFGRTEWEMLWGMKQINAEAAWAISTGSRDVVVAISDTGAFDHLELKPNFWKNPGETGLDANGKDKSKNKIDDDANGFIDDFQGAGFDGGYSNMTYDRHYHGTHVSGSVGAFGPDKTGVVGSVWVTSLMELPFIGGDGSGTDEDAVRTILYAANNGARVLNGSWGGSDDSKALRDAIDTAGKKGLLMVFAAGNDGENTDKHPHIPSAIDSPYIISVAASTAAADMAGFSNYGKVSVDLGAPGDSVYSSFNPMCNCAERKFYNTLSGTSMAAPHVAGAAALIFSINPKLTNVEVKQILITTVTQNKHFTDTVSGGILNLGEAAKLAKSTVR